jgi:hypothetical protein
MTRHFPLARDGPAGQNGRMSNRYYHIAWVVAAVLCWGGYAIARMGASAELQLVFAVAGIVLPFAVALIAIALVLMRAYTEAEPDPLEELAKTYRQKDTTAVSFPNETP